MVGLVVWSSIEMGVGIIAMCLATLRPLLRTFNQIVSSIRSRSRSRQSSSSSSRRSDRSERPEKSDRSEKSSETQMMHPNAPRRAFLDSATDTNVTTNSRWLPFLDTVDSEDSHVASNDRKMPFLETSTDSTGTNITSNGRRLPFLDSSNSTGTNMTVDSSLTHSGNNSSEPAATNKAVGRKIKRNSWWKPPLFQSGLMTDVHNAVRTVHDEETTGSGKSDVEMGGFDVPKLRSSSIE
jgi:hypothetical protein